MQTLKYLYKMLKRNRKSEKQYWPVFFRKYRPVRSYPLFGFAWFAFSEMKHAVSFGRGDSVPRISTGKLIKENGAYLLPISISGHHALMDGRNVAELIEKLETTKK